MVFHRLSSFCLYLMYSWLDVKRPQDEKQQKKRKLTLNPTALRKAKIVYNFGFSECNRVKSTLTHTLYWDLIRLITRKGPELRAHF